MKANTATKTKKQRHVGIYVRVSQDRSGENTTARQEADTDASDTTARQEEDHRKDTIARQVDDCRNLCEQRGWTVVKTYRDPDVSAFDLRAKRDEYERLLADVREGRIDTIVVWKLDRLARRTREVLKVVDLLSDCNADLVSLNDAIDTTGPTGRFTLTIMAAVAELESEFISLRVKRGKLEEAQNGKDSRGGNLAFGWKVETRKAKKSDKIVKVRSNEVDPEQADAIREVARRFLDNGESLNALARELNERGFRMPSGKRFRIQSVRGILVNPRIAKYRVHRPDPNKPANLYEAEWDRIIDDDTFRRLQTRFGNEIVRTADGLQLVTVGTQRRKVSTKRHLLTGFLWCAVCKTERMRLMTSSNHRDKPRYICAGCASNTVDAQVAEEHVAREALTMLMGRRMLGHDKPEVDVAAIEANVEAIREKLRKLSVAHFVDNVIDDDEYDAARVPLHEQLRVTEGRLTQAREMVASPLPTNAAILGFDEWWATATFDERRRVLDGAVDKVMVKPLTHEITALFRRPDVNADPKQSPYVGVPKALWPATTKARLTIEWRPEIMAAPVGELKKARRRTPQTPQHAA